MTKPRVTHPHGEFLGEPVKADPAHATDAGGAAATDVPSGHRGEATRAHQTEVAPPRAKGDVEHTPVKARFASEKRGK